MSRFSNSSKTIGVEDDALNQSFALGSGPLYCKTSHVSATGIDETFTLTNPIRVGEIVTSCGAALKAIPSQTAIDREIREYKNANTPATQIEETYGDQIRDEVNKIADANKIKPETIQVTVTTVPNHDCNIVKAANKTSQRMALKNEVVTIAAKKPKG